MFNVSQDHRDLDEVSSFAKFPILVQCERWNPVRTTREPCRSAKSRATKPFRQEKSGAEGGSQSRKPTGMNLVDLEIL